VSKEQRVKCNDKLAIRRAADFLSSWSRQFSGIWWIDDDQRTPGKNIRRKTWTAGYKYRTGGRWEAAAENRAEDREEWSVAYVPPAGSDEDQVKLHGVQAYSKTCMYK